jgi:membrane protein DedA with SNARE-associated domain
MSKGQHIIGGILWVIVVTAIGYLLCSLFSLSFDMDEWNGFSNVVKWIIGGLDIFLISDIIRIPFDNNYHY